MAKYYVTLEYGIYNGCIITKAEYFMLRKHGVVVEVVEE